MASLGGTDDPEFPFTGNFEWYREPQAFGDQPEVSEPAAGRALIASGLLIALGGVLPWARIPSKNVTLTGLDLGWFTTASGGLIAVAGVIILLRCGRVWVSLTALTFALLSFVIAAVLAESIDADQAANYDVAPAQVSIEYGLGITVGTTLMAMVCAGYALFRRNPRPPLRRRAS